MTEAQTCTVNLNNGQRILECRRGMTLFAALRTHKILLPTGCGARGQCGQCKVRLTGGSANLMTDSEVKLISEEERQQGHRLGCQLRLSEDISVQVRDYVFDAREHAAILTEIIPLTADIKRISFALDAGDAIDHLAGQFVTLSVRIPEAKAQAMRCFSFATQSTVKDRVDIIVKKNPRGLMTPYLFEQARPGDKVTLVGPYGDFYLRPGGSPCVWIAGGSGLSPFLGMIHDLIDDKITRPVHLFYGAVLPGDLYYVDLFNDLARRNPWFRFTPALSGEERTDSCLDYGLVTDVVAKYVSDASASEGYLCGSPGMIGACLKVLTEKGMRRDKIYYDRF